MGNDEQSKAAERGLLLLCMAIDGMRMIIVLGEDSVITKIGNMETDRSPVRMPVICRLPGSSRGELIGGGGECEFRYLPAEQS